MAEDNPWYDTIVMPALLRWAMDVFTCDFINAFGAATEGGLQTSLSYVRDVVPAHALANVYEWQFSLTSILTSLGVAARGYVTLASRARSSSWPARRRRSSSAAAGRARS